MSGPLHIDAFRVRRLAEFMEAINKASRETGVYVGAYGPVAVYVNDETTIEMDWDAEAREYVLNDRVGS